MNKLILPFVLVAAIGASSGAMAAGTVTKGVVKSFDTKACTVTLVDKSVYSFGNKCDFSKIKAAEKVTITWTMKGKVKLASQLVATA